MQVVRANFRPEFLNRVDEVILFHRLKREQMETIVEIQLARLRKLLGDRKITLELDDERPQMARRQGLRPRLRRAAAEARHPETGAGPARRKDPRRRSPRRRHGKNHGGHRPPPLPPQARKARRSRLSATLPPRGAGRPSRSREKVPRERETDAWRAAPHEKRDQRQPPLPSGERAGVRGQRRPLRVSPHPASPRRGEEGLHRRRAPIDSAVRSPLPSGERAG